MTKKIKDLGILAQFDDKSIHQVIVTEQQQQHILSYLIQTSKNNSLIILQNELHGVEWSSHIDLSGDVYSDGNGY